MNRGCKLIDDDDQRFEVAQLNLEAGEKGLASSAFQSATKYLLTGVSILGPNSWEANYDLTIKLYDAGKVSLFYFHNFSLTCSTLIDYAFSLLASEALFVVGDFTRLFEVIEQPLLNARSFEDKLNIHNNLVRALAGKLRSLVEILL